MNGKLQSILGYLGLVLWAIAYFGGKEQRDDLSRYHLKQGLGLIATSFVAVMLVFVLGIAVPKLAFIISSVIYLLLFILTVIGIINAVNDAKKPLPIVGKIFEDKFDFIDN